MHKVYLSVPSTCVSQVFIDNHYQVGVKVIMPNFYVNKDKLCAEFDFGDYSLYPNEVNYLSYRSKYICFSNLY